jgi:hypothetical protein
VEVKDFAIEGWGRPGVSNSKALEGHISGKKCSAGRILGEKWLCGPHLLSKTMKPQFLIEI